MKPHQLLTTMLKAEGLKAVAGIYHPVITVHGVSLATITNKLYELEVNDSCSRFCKTSTGGWKFTVED